MCLADRIEFCLLLRSEKRPDLGGGVLHHGLYFLHRFLVDRDDLRPSLIDDWRYFRALIGREVELFSQMFERVSHVAAPSAVFVASWTFCVKCERSQREAGGCRECNQCSFHMLVFYGFCARLVMRFCRY